MLVDRSSLRTAIAWFSLPVVLSETRLEDVVISGSLVVLCDTRLTNHISRTGTLSSVENQADRIRLEGLCVALSCAILAYNC